MSRAVPGGGGPVDQPLHRRKRLAQRPDGGCLGAGGERVVQVGLRDLGVDVAAVRAALGGLPGHPLLHGTVVAAAAVEVTADGVAAPGGVQLLGDGGDALLDEAELRVPAAARAERGRGQASLRQGQPARRRPGDVHLLQGHQDAGPVLLHQPLPVTAGVDQVRGRDGYEHDVGRAA